MTLNEYLEKLDTELVTRRLSANDSYFPSAIPLIKDNKIHAAYWMLKNVSYVVRIYEYSDGEFKEDTVLEHAQELVQRGYEFFDPMQDTSIMTMIAHLQALGFKINKPRLRYTHKNDLKTRSLVEFTARHGVHSSVNVTVNSFMFIDQVPFYSEVAIKIKGGLLCRLRVHYEKFSRFQCELDLREFEHAIRDALKLTTLITVECAGEQVEIDSDMQRKLMSPIYEKRFFMYRGERWVFAIVREWERHLVPSSVDSVEIPTLNVTVVPVFPVEFVDSGLASRFLNDNVTYLR